MSWITPELIEILLTILKAVVILLVVVTCGAFMSFGERRLLGLFAPAGCGHDQNVL